MRVKRLSYGAAGLIAAVILLFGVGTTWSYLKTALEVIQDEVEESVPPSFHLERLKRMVEELVPEVQRNRVALAEAEVDVERLEEEIAERRQALEQAREHIVKRRAKLNDWSEDLFVGGSQYTRRQVEDDLASRLDRYEVAEEELATKENLLKARRKVVEAAARKLRNYQRDQQQLGIQVAQIESQLNLVESMKDSHKLEFNHTKLADGKRLASYLKRKLDVAERVLADAAIIEEGIPDELVRDVIQEIDAKFGQPEPARPEPEGITRR
ncbi:MAG: hypothetical protein ACYTG0_12010 [Planctomycetota bacterium]|jgi:chromosome segregation ATPase